MSISTNVDSSAWLPHGRSMAVIHKACDNRRIKSGQTHMQRYLAPLLDKIERAEIDPSFVITRRVNLDGAPEAYAKFRDKTDNCIKVVIKPAMAGSPEIAGVAAIPEILSTPSLV